MDELLKYFPSLTDNQRRQFMLMDEVYRDWNAKINVISRKDIDNLYPHHVLHSLALAQIMRFRPDTNVMDLGTGGGFPGIPLAVMFPDTHFHLIDSIGKKIRVCNEVTAALGLQNVTTTQCRAEEEKGKFHFVVSRAVMPLPELIHLIRKNIAKEQFNSLPNGLLCLKGGDLQEETRAFKNRCEITDLATIFPDNEYFTTKKAVYVNLA